MGTHPFSQAPAVLRRNQERFLRGVDRIAKEAAKKGGRVIAETTRVDTGLARSNYQASIGAQSRNIVPPYARGNMLGIGEQGNLLGVLQQHAGVLNGWKPTGGQPFFITNNIPYIGFLNSGGAHVAAGNMLTLARQAASASVQNTKRIII